MVALFRAMRIEMDGFPVCGRTGSTLGVRTEHEEGRCANIVPDESGFVHPGMGGMSVSPDSPRNLPPHRRPRELGGTGKDPVFTIFDQQLEKSLAFRRDPGNPESHGFVGPAVAQSLAAYEEALWGTRLRWRRL